MFIDCSDWIFGWKILQIMVLWFIITPRLFLGVEVKSNQHVDPLLMELKKSVLSESNESLSQGGDSVLRY